MLCFSDADADVGQTLREKNSRIYTAEPAGASSAELPGALGVVQYRHSTDASSNRAQRKNRDSLPESEIPQVAKLRVSSR
jgi:hypothetical protein